MTDSAATAAFKLSRVYAAGWNAAGKLSANDYLDLNPQKLAALNPYAADPEKSRWAEGFNKALANPASRTPIQT